MRWGTLPAAVLLVTLVLATPVAASNDAVTVDVQSPSDGAAVSGEVELSWDLSSTTPVGSDGRFRVDAWACDGWHLVDEGDLTDTGSSSTIVDTTTLPDCPDAQLKVSVRVGDVAASDSVTVAIDNRQADLDLSVVSTTPAGGGSGDASATLEWTNADPNPVSTTLLAVDTSTGGQLWTDAGHDGDGRTVVTLPAGSAMLEAARSGALAFRVCTDAPTVEKQVCASATPELDDPAVEAQMEVDVTFTRLPSEQCTGQVTIEGTARARTEAGGDQGATVEKVLVRIDGRTTTAWSEAKLEGNTWTWTAPCPTKFGDYHVEVRVKATVPDPETQSQWRGPFTRGFQLLDEDTETAVAEIDAVDPSACKAGSDGKVRVQGTVRSPNLVKTVSYSVRDAAGDQLLSPPWQAAALKNTAAGDAKLDFAFDCPAEGTYKLALRVTPITGTASTLTATFEVSLPGGPGRGPERTVLNVRKHATVEALGNGRYEATFDVDDLHGESGVTKGIVGLVVRFRADPARTYLALRHEPDVEARSGVHRCDVVGLELIVDGEEIRAGMARPTLRVADDCVEEAKAKFRNAQATVAHGSEAGWTVHAAEASGWTSDAVEYTSTFEPEQGSALSPYAMAFQSAAADTDSGDGSSPSDESAEGPIDQVAKEIPGPDGLDVIALVGVLAGIAVSIGVVAAKLSGDDRSRRRPPRPPRPPGP